MVEKLCGRTNSCRTRPLRPRPPDRIPGDLGLARPGRALPAGVAQRAPARDVAGRAPLVSGLAVGYVSCGPFVIYSVHRSVLMAAEEDPQEGERRYAQSR